jgi:hypothetical protein
VALVTSIYMNRDGTCYPGGARLRDDTGLSLRTVRTALAKLEDTGWLTVLRRGSALPGRERIATEYRFSYPLTGARGSPVQEVHRCNGRQGPVQLTTPTGAAVALQEDLNLKRKRVRSKAQPSYVRETLWIVQTITDPNIALAEIENQLGAGRTDEVIAAYEIWKDHRGEQQSVPVDEMF